MVISETKNEFDKALVESGSPLRRAETEILQINVGKLCNLWASSSQGGNATGLDDF